MRCDANRLLELLNRFVEPPLCREGGAEVVVRLTKVGPQGRRPCEMVERPLDFHLRRRVEQNRIRHRDVVHVAAGELLRTEPVVGLPGVFVVLQRVGPEFVLVHPGDGQPIGDPGEHGEPRGTAGHEQRPLAGGQPVVPARDRRRDQRDHADHRQVDEVVCCPGDPHVGDRDEPEHRRDHQQEEAEAKDHVPPPRGPVLPQPPRRAEDHRNRQELPDLGRVDFPAGVDRQEVHRPEDHGEVKQRGHPGDRQTGQDPLDRRQTVFEERWDDDRLLADGPAVLVVDRDEAEHDRDQEVGQRPHEVADGDLAPLPPGVEQQDHRHRDNRRLGEHGEQEEHDRQAVVQPLRLILLGRIVKLHEADRREQEERHRERVLEFRHPGHALHADGMHGEEDRPEPGARDFHDGKEPPEQQGADRVQHHARHVEARGPWGRWATGLHGTTRPGIHLEKRPLRPQRRVAQREVVGAFRIEPEFGEGGRVIRRHARVGRDAMLDGRIGREQLVVIPQPIGVVHRMTDRRIDPEACQHDDGGPHQPLLPATCRLGVRRRGRHGRGRGLHRAALDLPRTMIVAWTGHETAFRMWVGSVLREQKNQLPDPADGEFCSLNSVRNRHNRRGFSSFPTMYVA